MLSNELVLLVESIWGETLGGGVRRLRPDEPLPERSPLLTASVRIEGEATRVVMVACSHGLARAIAATMFKIDAAAASLDDVRDAIGEVVNILGGNVKATLPPPHTLSLPVVAERDRGADLTAELVGSMGSARFEYNGEPLFVAVTRA